jgi:hypothetical protein
LEDAVNFFLNRDTQRLWIDYRFQLSLHGNLTAIFQ